MIKGCQSLVVFLLLVSFIFLSGQAPTGTSADVQKASTTAGPSSPSEQSLLLTNQPATSQQPVPTTQRKSIRTRRHSHTPPPTGIDLESMSIPDFVTMKEKSFRAPRSESWIRAFGAHPSIKDLHKDSPSSSEYAVRYHQLYRQDTDRYTGKRMMDAITAHLQAYNFPSDYIELVKQRLRGLRRWAKGTRQEKKLKMTLGAEAYREYKNKTAKTRSLEQKVKDADLFASVLERAKIQQPHTLTPKELEIATREMHTLMGVDKKRASANMVTFMNLTKRYRAEDIIAAKLARTSFNAGVLAASMNEKKKKARHLASSKEKRKLEQQSSVRVAEEQNSAASPAKNDSRDPLHLPASSQIDSSSLPLPAAVVSTHNLPGTSLLPHWSSPPKPAALLDNQPTSIEGDAAWKEILDWFE